MVILYSKLIGSYLATKNLRNTGVKTVSSTEEAQKFPSRRVALESMQEWEMNFDEWDIQTYYYPTQNSFSKIEPSGF